jgi:hypothetical protein
MVIGAENAAKSKPHNVTHQVQQEARIAAKLPVAVWVSMLPAPIGKLTVVSPYSL